MKFYSFNFKLIVINELIALGLLDREMAPIYEKQEQGYYEKHFEALENGSGKPKGLFDDDEFDDDFDDFFDDGADEYYNSHPEMEEEVDAIGLTPEMLAQIEKLDFDYGEIQGMLAPHWHGEDEQFCVSDIRDIRLLPNLKEVKLSFVLDDDIKDLSPLLDVPQLKKVSTVPTLTPEYFFDNHTATRSKLEAKGIKVVKGR
jgi:hypothetical protein